MRYTPEVPRLRELRAFYLRLPVFRFAFHLPPTVSSARWVVTLVLGVIMFGLGLYVGVRPLWTHNAVVTGARWLDMVFAAVFMLRGVLNVRIGMQRRRTQFAQG